MGWTFYNASGEALTSFGPVALTDLDIDGGTDIGEAIVDADLFIVDNGAGGTNVKTQASRILTYIGSASGVAKAHGTVTGGTLQSNSFNIASTSLDSTGVYTCNWDTDFANANYASIMVPEAGANRCCTVDNPGTASVTCRTYIASTGAADSNNWQIAAFGDQ